MKRYIHANNNIKILYEYEGPIYRYGEYVEDVKLQTTATSYKQACVNFLTQIKKRKNVSYANRSYRIDYHLIQPIFADVPKQASAPTCDYCNTRLNELGQCPICDLGEEDI